jgi:hypothetical protein
MLPQTGLKRIAGIIEMALTLLDVYFMVFSNILIIQEK